MSNYLSHSGWKWNSYSTDREFFVTLCINSIIANVCNKTDNDYSSTNNALIWLPTVGYPAGKDIGI